MDDTCVSAQAHSHREGTLEEFNQHQQVRPLQYWQSMYALLLIPHCLNPISIHFIPWRTMQHGYKVSGG
jgi:hypothetical protein